MHQCPPRADEAQVDGFLLPKEHGRREGDVVAVEEGVDGRVWRCGVLVASWHGRVRLRQRAGLGDEEIWRWRCVKMNKAGGVF